MKEIPLAPHGVLRESTGRLTAEFLGLWSNGLNAKVNQVGCDEIAPTQL